MIESINRRAISEMCLIWYNHLLQFRSLRYFFTMKTNECIEEKPFKILMNWSKTAIVMLRGMYCLPLLFFSK